MKRINFVLVLEILFPNRTNFAKFVLGTLFFLSLLLAGCALPFPINKIIPGKTTGNQTGSHAGGSGITFNTSVNVGGTWELPAATSGQLYNARITPSGGSPPYNCSAAPNTTMPGELIFSEPGCSITGTAPILSSGTATEIFPISFIIRDSGGTVGGPFYLDLVVNQQAPKLSLIESINSATIGTPYQYNFCDPSAQSGVNCGQLASAVNRSGTGPYTFTATGLPLGLNMNLNGLLSGTVPNGAIPKEYTINVCVRDSTTATETCGDTNIQVIDRTQQTSPDCPYDGVWSGTVSASGKVDSGYHGATKPYSINFDLEVTLKCDDDYRDSSGKLVHLYNVTRVKASHPFFNCANGCIPVSYSQGGQVSYVELAEDRKTPEAIAIRFPNNVLLQGTHTLLSRDGTKIVDEVSWPPLVSHSIAWEVGSTKKIETYGCTDCFNAYPDRTRIELTKVS